MSTTNILLKRLLEQKMVLPDIKITKKFGITMVTDEAYLPELLKLLKGLRLNARELISLPRISKDVPEEPWTSLLEYLSFLTSSWYKPSEELITNINFFYDRIQIEFSFEDLDPIREDEKALYDVVNKFATEMTATFDFEQEVLRDMNSITVYVKR